MNIKKFINNNLILWFWEFGNFFQIYSFFFPPKAFCCHHDAKICPKRKHCLNVINNAIGPNRGYYGWSWLNLIKSFKDFNARLMDGANDGATSINSVSHSAHHNGSCSCIQPTSWLIHEDNGWVGHQLHCNG